MSKMRKACILLFLVMLTTWAKAQDYASIKFSNKVISSFTQGDYTKSNRATISLVKCAIATFGLDGVLKKIKTIPGKFIITLRNGDSLSLSPAELALCKARCGFKLMGDERIFDKAVLLYAIIAKRAIGSPDPAFSKCTNLATALAILHNRFKDMNVLNLVPLLGFDYIQVKIYSEICYVHQNGTTAAFACYSIFDDEGLGRRLDAAHWSKRYLSNKEKVGSKRNIILTNFVSDTKLDNTATAK